MAWAWASERGRREGQMDPRRRCPAPSRRSSSRCPGRWSPWPVPGNRGCLTPRLPPLPPRAGPPGPPPGPCPSGLAERDTARPCPPPGLPSPGAGRERSLSLSPREVGTFAQPVPSRARTSTRSRAGRVCMGHHLTEPRLTPEIRLCIQRLGHQGQGPSGFQIEVLLSINV